MTIFPHIESIYQRVLRLRQQTTQPSLPPDLVEAAWWDLYQALDALQAFETERQLQTQALFNACHRLEADRQYYYDLFNQAPDGYLITNAQGTIQEANLAIAAMLNVPQQFLIGKPLAIFILEVAHSDFYAALDRMLHDQPNLPNPSNPQWELRLRPCQGAPFNTAITVTSVRQADHSTTLHWLVRQVGDRQSIGLGPLHSQDLTDSQDLIHSQDLKEAIYNESADAIFLVDVVSLLTLDCNCRAVELFEVANKQDLIGIEGHTLQKQLFTHDEMDAIDKDIRELGFWSREIEYITKTGRNFWGNLAVKPIHLAGNCINLVRVTDITDRKQAEAALRQSEAHKSALISALPDLIMRMDRDGTFLEFNPTNTFKVISQPAIVRTELGSYAAVGA